MTVFLHWKQAEGSPDLNGKEKKEIENIFSQLKETPSEDEVEWISMWHHLISQNILPKPEEWQSFISHNLVKTVWDLDLSNIEEF
jgi:hypothetical protein